MGLALSFSRLKSHLAELVDHWGHLEALLENGTLTLDADILGPLDEAGQVALGLDVAACFELASIRLIFRTYQFRRTWGSSQRAGWTPWPPCAS